MKMHHQKNQLRIGGVIALVLVFTLCGSCTHERKPVNSGDFAAYYTRIQTGADWELFDRTDEFADIAVVFGAARGKLIFWRGTSYLPNYENASGKRFPMDEIIPRHGDGNAVKPDKFNTYSQVKIVENSPARIIVNWRYVPDFKLVHEKNWVDEDYIIYPEGRIIRIIRKSGRTLEEWEDANNRVIKKYDLVSSGIIENEKLSNQGNTLTKSSSKYFIQEEFDKVNEIIPIKTARSGAPGKLVIAVSEPDHPKLLIKNWGDIPVKKIKINSETFQNYQSGHIKNLDGTDLIVWLNIKQEKNATIEIIPEEYEPPENEKPIARAGNDQWLLVNQKESGPYLFELNGSYSDDGSPKSKLHTSWKIIEGTGEAIINEAGNLNTTVSIPVEGSYLFQLTVDDTELKYFDTVSIIVEKYKGSYGDPIAWWNFEKHQGNKVTEMISNKEMEITGNSTWVKGVTGNGLEFSEFQNFIQYPYQEAPKVNPDAFSIEAWIAIKSYPWYKIPIAMQRSQNAGYYFGIDGDNKLFLNVFVKGKWEKCETAPPYPDLTLNGRNRDYIITKSPEITLPLLKWTHVTGTFNSNEGIKLYVDGVLKAENKIRGSMRVAGESDFFIGMDTGKNYPAHTERPDEGTDKSLYSYDGLMDEIKIYNSTLSQNEVVEACNFKQPYIRVPLKLRKAPRGPDGPKAFGAYQATLKFNDMNYDRCWRPGNNADVLVYFDEFDFKMVWWHGVAYYPVYYSGNGIGLTHEVCETRTPLGCAEALMDKECRYAYVQVLENTDARVVVKFRSAASDRQYFIAHEDPERDGWGCWTDEILTIYPDGTMPRQVTMWCSKQNEWHEFEQENYFFNPGQNPWNVVENELNTIANLKGEVSDLKWVNNWPKGKFIDNAVIKTYNYKDSETRPFAIVLDGLSVVYASPEVLHDYTLEPAGWWDHWPVSQIPCDGKWPIFPNGHFSSSSSGAIFTSNHLGSPAQIDFPAVVKTHDKMIIPYLFGMTDKNAGALVPLAKMYNNPPEISRVKGADYERYNVFRTEYVFSNPGNRISFTVDASSESPVANICFIIKKWDQDKLASITMNQKMMDIGKISTGRE